LQLYFPETQKHLWQRERRKLNAQKTERLTTYKALIKTLSTVYLRLVIIAQHYEESGNLEYMKVTHILIILLTYVHQIAKAFFFKYFRN